ncbi:phosphoribosylaminoimidazolesuccinocarboxamide synthase [Pseudonocardia nantongensis]|uniref:phosphoribosylaminoimidazolesuccinocarboxamide synthase n=1 Tax=Pseudonocardia nantongensis TaxID=1181885 RepID=UPI0039787FBB
MKLVHSGKVRELYLDESVDPAELLLVASDRLSIYDVVLPTPVPDKGAILTALSLYWFDRTSDLVGNHVLGTHDVPAEFAGRAVRCRPLEMLPVECIARGYLTGLGLQEYGRDGTVSGVRLPDGLVEGSQLPEPIFTPTTKAPVGSHDEFMTFDEVVATVGGDTAEQLRSLTLEVYRRGAAAAAAGGILVADTKLEFGRDTDGGIVLGDEVLTPDSSRFWPADSYEPGHVQFSFDKQYVRDWSAGLDWDRTAPGPEVPEEVVQVVRERYAEVYRRITGTSWTSPTS